MVAVEGDKVLEKITLKRCKTGEEKTVPAKAVFIYIGAKPGTSWVNGLYQK